ncbi:MAG: TetR/AcrR family transcriptional regulator [Candidatus Marinimicrobia bacterium]|nr:TetR/AcrR family transcriptional regulator [Candidatus Neomarinimicrobiota bacterium]
MTHKTFPSIPGSNTPEGPIMEHGLDVLFRNGVRGFTVESLAKDLAMSKKTIYKFFPTKEILLQRIFEYITTIIAVRFQKVLAQNINPLDKFLHTIDLVINNLNRVSITRISEIKARYPNIWKQLEIFRLERREDFLTIFIQAKDAGYIRDEVDLELTATLFMNIINDVFQPEFFIKNQLHPKDVLIGFRNIFLRGIITNKGLKYIEEKL